ACLPLMSTTMRRHRKVKVLAGFCSLRGRLWLFFLISCPCCQILDSFVQAFAACFACIIPKSDRMTDTQQTNGGEKRSRWDTPEPEAKKVKTSEWEDEPAAPKPKKASRWDTPAPGVGASSAATPTRSRWDATPTSSSDEGSGREWDETPQKV